MRILRSLAALLILIGTVVGAPILLWNMGSGLLPDGMPSPAEIWDTLTNRDTGQVFLGVLVVAGFLAWTVFTGCVLIDIAARLTGRRAVPRIRFLRVPQSAAAGLISMILAGSAVLGAAGPALAATTGPDLHRSLTAVTAVNTVTITTAQAASTPPAAPAAAGQNAQTQQAEWSGPVWVVARYDTFWGIAEQTLGDGRRYQEIVELNVGVPQVGGSTIKDASTNLEIGWQLRLPVDAAATSTASQVTVRPGDTLSQIAADRLGSASRYAELAALNNIADPDLIEVGDTIELSASTVAVALPDDAPPPADPAPPDPAGDVGQNEPPPANPPAAGGTVAEPIGPLVPESPPPAAAAPTPAAGQNQTPPGPTTEVDQDQAADLPVVAAGVGLSAVLVAAAWIGLRAARRRKSRHRPAGEFPVPTSLSAARMERRVREHAATRDVLWLDHALRLVAHLTADRDPADLPDVTCAWLSEQELQLQLAAPVPAPAPFTADGDSWLLSVGTELPQTEESTDPAAPFPLLTSLGEMDGETLLVDLERLGAVSITGDHDRTRDLLVHLAVELATNTWSDHLQVTLVGWGADLVTLNPDRIRHLAEVGDVTTLVQSRVTDTQQALDELHTTVLADRLVDEGAGDWSPEVWLIDAADGDDLAALEDVLTAVSTSGRVTVAVVARSDRFAPTGGAVIHVDGQGALTLPAVLGDLRVQAAAASPDTLERLLELFESAGRFTPPGPMTSPDPWARGMTTDGSLIPEELLVGDPAGSDGAGEATNDIGQKATEPSEPSGDPVTAQDAGIDDEDVDVDQEPTGQEPGQVLPLRPAPSPAAAAILQSTLAADEYLDDDVTEWFTPTPRRPQVAVLGPPTVTASGTAPSGRLARMTEMAVYLGTHREVDADKFVTDLWAEDATVKAVSRRSDVSRVRAWLGVDEQGHKYLPEARSKPYRMTRLLDLDLFRRLRKRADARAGAGDAAGAQRDLLTALMLVRGPVMDQAPPDAYGWLLTSDPAGVQQASLMVIATAHQLVNGSLADNDLDLARVAADIAHRVDPNEDQPLCDLLRISHRGGDDLDARSWALLLLQSNGVETPEDLPNFDSYRTVNEVFPRGLRAASAAING